MIMRLMIMRPMIIRLMIIRLMIIRLIIIRLMIIRLIIIRLIIMRLMIMRLMIMRLMIIRLMIIRAGVITTVHAMMVSRLPALSSLRSIVRLRGKQINTHCTDALSCVSTDTNIFEHETHNHASLHIRGPRHPPLHNS
jgi:hypothetical protein